jgi:predicted dehydrogenase
LSSEDVTSQIANNPVRIAVVGLHFGRSIVKQLLAESAKRHCTLTAVCDLDATRVAAVAGESGVPAVTNLDALLADPHIEAVGLFTGPVGRANLIRKIIRAGKHVLTTKPFERDATAAADVLREANQLGRVVHLNSPAPQPSADLQQVRQWQEKFNLGRPVACRAEVWASYREKPDGSWYDDPEACPVAPIFRLGIYVINDMIQLLGEPEAVQVMQTRLFTGRPTPDNAQLGIRFKNGAIANVFASFCVDDGQMYSNSMVLNYQNGTISRNIEPKLFAQRHLGSSMSVVAKAGPHQTTIERVEHTEHSGQYLWQAFQQAVRTGPGADTTTAEQIVAGVKVANAMAKAAKSGREERV